MPTPRLRLGQLLVDARMITQEALDEVLASQKQDGRRLGILMVERGLINETQLTQILSHQLSVPWVSLLHIEFSRQLLNLVPHDVAERFCLVPIYVRHVRGQGQTLYVAMDDPTNEDALRECQTFSGLPVRAMIAPPTDIRNAIRVYYGGGVPRPSSSESTPNPRPVGEAPRARRSDRPPRRSPSGEFPTAVVPPPPQVPDLAAEPAPEAVSVEAREPEPSDPDVAAAARTSEPEIPPPVSDAPEIEAAEVPLSAASAEKVEEEVASEPIPKPRGRAPRMVSLTLLDGTTITLPARKRRRDDERHAEARRPRRPGSEDDVGLTARDLVAALRAVSHGADATEILGNNVRWEVMFAALLSLLLKKHLIADWEFVDEFKRI